jgi:putative Mn2+ efflux pump MntP
MSPVAIAVLAFGMSIDAFLASIGRGAGLRRSRLREAIGTGLVFGLIETLTPLIGWAAGIAASRYVAAVDHWIAFGLLAFVGGRMILHAFQRSSEAPDAERSGSLLALVTTAFATSIDAMAVGVSLAFLNVNILVIALAIGTATFVMSTGGMLAGRLVGKRFGTWAEVVGGVALFGLGLSILVDHLSA